MISYWSVLFTPVSHMDIVDKHKLLEPFLYKGIKIPRFNRWSMELVDYNITSIISKAKTMSWWMLSPG